MNRRYKFYLVKWTGEKKTVIVTYPNLTLALERIRESYSDWEISMFWPEWP